MGASAAIERDTPALAALPADFDVTLNFGAWGSESTLVAKLGPSASGHATTVHPLLANFDSRGWLGGVTAGFRDWKGAKSAVRAHSPNARYAWTLFRPVRAAQDVLEEGVRQGRFDLPVGIAEPLDEAEAVFDHVARGGRGRGVLLP